ncbi:MAG: LVIVD repeat-containing protein [Haloglomus sp.]
MNRRSFLRRGLGFPLALAGVGTVEAVEERSSDDGTPPSAAPAGFAPLAEHRIPRAKEAVVSADGRTAFLAVTDGFAVVDLAAPDAPEVVHENRAPWAGEGNGRLEQIYDVKLDRANDLLAVVGPASQREVFKGVIVYDVSEPTAPEKVAVFETEFFNHNCFATGGYVYLCGNASDRKSLVVVDARAGEAVGRWSIADVNEQWTSVGPNWVLHDVYVHDGVAYLAHWDAGTVLLDVSDPTAPSFLTRIDGQSPSELAALTSAEAADESLEPPGNDHYVATNDDGTLLGVGVESWDADPTDDTGGPGGVTLFDVSDPATPEQVSVLEPPPTPDPTFDGIWTTSHNFSFRGDRLYTSWYEGGVRVYDVSDPADPALLARWRASDDASMWTAVPTGRGFFLATSHRDGPRAAEDSSAERAALYTFPDPPADAEPITSTPTPTPVSSPPTATRTPSGTATPTATRTLTRTSTVTAPPATDDDTGATDNDTGAVGNDTGTVGNDTGAIGNGTEAGSMSPTSATGPGFGPLAALGGLGLGAWRILRGDSGDRGE